MKNSKFTSCTCTALDRIALGIWTYLHKVVFVFKYAQLLRGSLNKYPRTKWQKFDWNFYKSPLPPIVCTRTHATTPHCACTLTYLTPPFLMGVFLNMQCNMQCSPLLLLHWLLSSLAIILLWTELNWSGSDLYGSDEIYWNELDEIKALFSAVNQWCRGGGLGGGG